MKTWLANIVWLVAVWLAVTESFTVAAVVGGVVVAAGLMVLFPSRSPAEEDVGVRISPVGLLRFVGYFFAKLLQANLQVAWAVIAPTRRPVGGIVAVPIAKTPTTVTSLLTSAVSLTPGTFIVEIQEQPPVLYVHVLQLTSVARVRSDVLRTQRAVVRALGPSGALDEIGRSIAALRDGDEPEREGT